MTWDTDIEMVGEFPVYWAVLKNDDGLTEVWASPYQQLPGTDEEETENRTGLVTYLVKPLTNYTDAELSIAAIHMCGLVMKDFLEAAVVNRIYKAMKEQRERQGGYLVEKTEKPAEG